MTTCLVSVRRADQYNLCHVSEVPNVELTGRWSAQHMGLARRDRESMVFENGSTQRQKFFKREIVLCIIGTPG